MLDCNQEVAKRFAFFVKINDKYRGVPIYLELLKQPEVLQLYMYSILSHALQEQIPVLRFVVGMLTFY